MSIAYSQRPERRLFLKALAGVVPAAIAFQTSSSSAAGKKTVRIVEFSPAGVRTGLVEVEKVEKPLAEWKKQLSPEQFAIARQAGTERPGSGKYANSHEDGLYHCVCCSTVLFDSKTKF